MPSKSAVVLIVDDDAAVRGALKFALGAEGFDVRDYGGPVALLSDSNLPKIGCLVVDYHMPIMNGLELVAALRARNVDAPVIIITGRVDKELGARAAKLGIGRVLEKPLPDGALVAAIRSALTTGG